MIPPKLEDGDVVRVVAPSRSLNIINDDAIAHAERVLESFGLQVTYGDYVNEADRFNSTSVEHRLEDLHSAFCSDAKLILTVIGGYNSNQLLDSLNYKIIADNPTLFCGYSDITALHNAIYAQTEMVTYSGPHFSTLGMREGAAYNHEYFKRCLFRDETYEITPSERWSDDEWYRGDERTFHDNDGPYVINTGRAEGIALGSNQCTFNLLHGTEYMPDLENTILFLEEDAWVGDTTAAWFDRNLQSIIHQPGFEGVQGICIGRFQEASKMTRTKVEQIIRTKSKLDTLPVVAGLDFGHTDQMFTFPVGGTVQLDAQDTVSLRIINR
jgi:muramoyltetrapeptide carboxypeptidase LdcA involved in peptidoglycan recycling